MKKLILLLLPLSVFAQDKLQKEKDHLNNLRSLYLKGSEGSEFRLQNLDANPVSFTYKSDQSLAFSSGNGIDFALYYSHDSLKYSGSAKPDYAAHIFLQYLGAHLSFELDSLRKEVARLKLKANE